MSTVPSIPRRIAQLDKLGTYLRTHGIPDEVVTQAVTANPWFTPYYIRYALEAVLPWLDASHLNQLVAQYPQSPHNWRVGIIAAGNVPLVGLHDIIITLLAGHEAVVKCARKDTILMEWFRACWLRLYPEVAHIFHITNMLEDVDFLLATGSNNTARYISHAFQQVPRVIRGHRYSVAILDENTDDDALEGLAADMLLHNGLGCRNVSNLLLSPGFDLNRLRSILDAYPKDHLNSRYLERVLYVKHLKGVLGEPAYHFTYATLQESSRPKPAEMGIVYYTKLNKPFIISDWTSVASIQWQCIVGVDTPFGTTQRPALDTFADAVNTLKLLTQPPNETMLGL